jgi:hypothetical protein
MKIPEGNNPYDPMQSKKLNKLNGLNPIDEDFSPQTKLIDGN